MVCATSKASDQPVHTGSLTNQNAKASGYFLVATSLHPKYNNKDRNTRSSRRPTHMKLTTYLIYITKKFRLVFIFNDNRPCVRLQRLFPKTQPFRYLLKASQNISNECHKLLYWKICQNVMHLYYGITIITY